MESDTGSGFASSDSTFFRLNAVCRREGNKTLAFTPRAQVSLPDVNGSLLHELVKFDGFHSTKEILDGAPNSASLEALIPELVSSGVLVKASEIVIATRRLGDNPMAFGATGTVERVREVSRERAARAEYLGSVGDQLEAVMRERRSQRTFTDRAVELDDLRSLLLSSYSDGLNAAPSAGGLRPICVNAIVLRGVSPGIYSWDSAAAELERIGDVPEFSDLAYITDSEDVINAAPCILVLVGDLQNQILKYSNRAYRFALIEAGHVAQNIMLRAQAMGMGTLEWGGYLDQSVADLVSDGALESIIPLTMIAAGWPDNSNADVDSHIEMNLASWVDNAENVRWVTRRHPSGFRIVLSHLEYKKSDGSIGHASGVARATIPSGVKAMAEAAERIAATTPKAEFFGLGADLEGSLLVPGIKPDLCPVEKLASSERLSWSRGRSLGSSDPVWVPTDCVYYGAPSDSRIRSLVDAPNSSGTAAHSELRLAERSAVLELVERDAFRRAWQGETLMRSIPQTEWPAWLSKDVSELGRRGATMTIGEIGGLVTTYVVGIHADSTPALSVGASAGTDRDAAVEKAWFEAVSGYLVNGPLGDDVDFVEDVRVPLQHAFYYRRSDRARRIRSFFEGELEGLEVDSNARSHPSQADWSEIDELIDPVFVDLDSPVRGLHIVRAFSRSLSPLLFGHGSLADGSTFAATQLAWRPDLNLHPFP